VREEREERSAGQEGGRKEKGGGEGRGEGVWDKSEVSWKRDREENEDCVIGLERLN
jgi:hypothetical protein